MDWSNWEMVKEIYAASLTPEASNEDQLVELSLTRGFVVAEVDVASFLVLETELKEKQEN